MTASSHRSAGRTRRSHAEIDGKVPFAVHQVYSASDGRLVLHGHEVVKRRCEFMSSSARYPRPIVGGSHDKRLLRQAATVVRDRSRLDGRR
ncbi:hypothetical protein, partial [Rhodococcus sp. EPR-279]|uniref:hypothetical protein n=1 Tax=Rhodococcus sp. EPR-279 TaxID=1813678 RepID=UPI003FA79EF9